VGGGVGGRECGWQGVGRGLVWKGLMLLPAAPARTSGRREVKERKPGKERKTTKNIPRGPGLPRGGSRIPRVIGIPKSKNITLHNHLTYRHAHTYTYLDAHICTEIYVDACTYIYRQRHVDIRTYMHTNICMYAHRYA